MIEKLFDAIKEELRQYVKASEKLGWNDPYVTKFRNRIVGMEDAFEIIAGQSFNDYLERKIVS